jgi:hypothetical protein
VLAELWSPSQFDALARFVRPEDLDSTVRLSADPRQHLEWLQQDIEQGEREILLHNVNREQEPFIAVFGEHVLPVLKKVKGVWRTPRRRNRPTKSRRPTGQCICRFAAWLWTIYGSWPLLIPM